MTTIYLTKYRTDTPVYMYLRHSMFSILFWFNKMYRKAQQQKRRFFHLFYPFHTRNDGGQNENENNMSTHITTTVVPPYHHNNIHEKIFSSYSLFFIPSFSSFSLLYFCHAKNVFAISFGICLLFSFSSLFSPASFFSLFFFLLFSQVNYSGFLVPANFCLMCSPFLSR